MKLLMNSGWCHIGCHPSIVCESICTTNCRKQSYCLCPIRLWRARNISMLQLYNLGYNVVSRPVCARTARRRNRKWLYIYQSCTCDTCTSSSLKTSVLEVVFTDYNPLFIRPLTFAKRPLWAKRSQTSCSTFSVQRYDAAGFVTRWQCFYRFVYYWCEWDNMYFGIVQYV